MVDHAKTTIVHVDQPEFEVEKAKCTGLLAASVDLVLMHTRLCYVLGLTDVIKEACRALKLGVVLTICEGDQDIATAKTGEFDLLDQGLRFIIAQNVANMWSMRRVAEVLTSADFQLGARRVYSYLVEGKATIDST